MSGSLLLKGFSMTVGHRSSRSHDTKYKLKRHVFAAASLCRPQQVPLGCKLITLLHLSLIFCANIATEWFPDVIINIWHVTFSFLPLTCSRTPPYFLVLFQGEVQSVDLQIAQKQSGPSVVKSNIMDPEKKERSREFLETPSLQRVSLLREYLQTNGHILRGL